MKLNRTNLALLALIALLAGCASDKSTNNVCGGGLTPLNAKITQASDGSLNADISSNYGAIHGIPVQAVGQYSSKSETVTQCVIPAFADLLAKYPERFDITIDSQGLQLKSK